MRSIIVIAHNIRSIHNVGSILRTCDGFAIERVYCTGYTPYPTMADDMRLPHIRDKITHTLHKTALGAELSMDVRQSQDVMTVLHELKQLGYTLVGLEQSDDSTQLASYAPSEHVALIIGEEVQGINQALLDMCDSTIEIPMFGRKESFNVSVATGIALYHIRIS